MSATFAADGVLAAVLPADATCVRVADGVATSLDGDDGADVEVASSPDDLHGSSVGVVVLDADAGGLDTGTGGRLAVRVRDHAALRWRAANTRRALRAAGFRDITTVPWDRGQVAHLPAPARPPRPLRPAERLPRRAAVVAGRHDRGAAGPTILTAATLDAGLGPVAPWPLVRSGTLVVLDHDVVLRVAVGAGRLRIRRAADALARVATTLGAATALLPAVVAEGEAGLGAWSTERRLSGAPSPATLEPAVADDVLDVLAALHEAGAEPPSPATAAATIAMALSGSTPQAAAVERIGEFVGRDLAGLPGALGHGDFWHGNLLVRDGRLAGVIDWDAAVDGALPFGDALHLVIAARVPKGSTAWGAEVAAELDRDRPAPLVTRHAATIGIGVDPALHRALVAGYWLDRLATQLRTYADRVTRPRWLAANVDPFVRAWQGSAR